MPCITSTLDSGFVATGGIQNVGYEGVIMKLDSSGDTVWLRSFAQSDLFGMDVIQTSDSGYMSLLEKSISGSGDIYLIKTNDLGDTLWSKSYGGHWHEYAHAVRETYDGGFIFAGYSNSFGLGGNDIYIVRTTSSGDTLWTKVIGDIGDDQAGSIIQTPDSGFLISSKIDTCFCLIKLNQNGDTIWTKCYSHLGSWEIKLTPDGNIAVYGGMNLSKFDLQGDLLWSKKYELPDFINGSFDVLSNGEFILTGFGMYYGNQIDYNVLTDSSGDTLWCRSFIPSGSRSYSVASTYDHGFIFSGDSRILKIDSTGHSYCNESPLQLTISIPVAQRLYPGINVKSTNTDIGHPQLQIAPAGIITVYCSSLNSENENLEMMISVYPNPASNTISISSSFKISSWEITNILGKKKAVSLPIVNCKLPTNVDVSFLVPGIYFLRAETDQGTFTTKFIKE